MVKLTPEQRKEFNQVLQSFTEKTGITLSSIHTIQEEYLQINTLFSDSEREIRDLRKECLETLGSTHPALDSIQLSTIDGYSFYMKNGPSYNSNFDRILPNEVYGTRDPSSEERREGNRRVRRFYLPRQVKPLQRRNLEFWSKNDKSLAELQSKYPHLRVRIVWDRLTVTVALGLILKYYTKDFKRLYDSLVGFEILEKLEAESRKHNFQGRWALVGRLIQLSAYPILVQETLEEIYPSKRSRSSLIILAEDFLDKSYIYLNDRAPTSKQRKRGYSDKGSRKESHQNHEPKTLQLWVETANEGRLHPRDAREAFNLYLNGGLLPKKTYTTHGKEFLDIRSKDGHLSAEKKPYFGPLILERDGYEEIVE